MPCYSSHLCDIFSFSDQDANPNRLDNQYYQVLLTGDQVDEDFQLELQNNDGTVFPDQFLWRRGNDNDDQVRFCLVIAESGLTW